MIYHVIGTMSGSSLDGLDIVYAEISDIAGQWTYDIHAADTLAYSQDWVEKIRSFNEYSAKEYVQIDSDLGYYFGELIADFITRHDLQYKIHFISSHGHTTFHEPAKGYTGQIGTGANIAQKTMKPTITDLRQMDVAQGGQGAPIVPMAERLLFPNDRVFLNIGGIANVSIHQETHIDAFDVTAANRVLNLLAQQKELEYDHEGQIARSGKLDEQILFELSAHSFFDQKGPKSLANDFGLDIQFPRLAALSLEDAAHTYTHHIGLEIAKALQKYHVHDTEMLITGGGAYNTFLVEVIQNYLQDENIRVKVPDAATIEYKEALAMAMLGVLRWREEPTVDSMYSGADQPTIGGALWMV